MFQELAKTDETGLSAVKFFKTKGFYILLFLIFCISFFVYNNFIFFKDLFIYKGIGSDTYNQFVPSLVHFTNYLRTEGIPKWSFNQGMGQNVFPGGVNDPFNLFLYMFDGEHLPYMIVYAQLMKIMFGGLLFYLYLRTMHASQYASVTGGLLFSFSGYMILGGGWYGHASLVVYGIFLLFAFEKLFMENKWYYFPIAVAIISSQVFAFYLFSFFIFLYSLFRYYMNSNIRSKGILLLLLKMAGLGILGIGINAVFLTSPLLQMIDSPRVSGTAGYFDALKSAPVLGFAGANEYMSAIMRCFSNDLMGIGSDFKGWNNYLEAPVFYVGLITLLLIPQLFQFLNKKRKILFIFFSCFWLTLIIFPYFRYALYLFSGDYFKTGMSFFVPVTALFFAISALGYIDKFNKINLKILLITLVALLILLYFPYLPADRYFVDEELRKKVVFFLVIYTFLIILLPVKKMKVTAQILLLIFMVIELGYFSSLTVNRRIIQTRSDFKDKIGYNDYTVDAVDYLKSIDKSFYRINKNYSSGDARYVSFNDAMIQDYYGTPSYQSFNQLYYIKFLGAVGVLDEHNELQTRWAAGLVGKPVLETFANIKYSFTKTQDSTLAQHGYDSITTFGDVSVFKNRFYLPIGYTYDTYIYEKDLKNTSKKGRTLLHSVVISENQTDKFKDFTYDNSIDTTVSPLPLELYRELVNRLKQDTLAISEHTQNFFKGKIKLEKKKLLFFSIPYDRGWKATVDGNDAELELVNIGFMGIILDKGEHDVELKFEPPFLNAGLCISGVSLLLYGFLVWNTYRINRKKLKSPTTTV
ncbi:MAG: YfhO family protein [Bacteroidia bacterium]